MRYLKNWILRNQILAVPNTRNQKLVEPKLAELNP